MATGPSPLSTATHAKLDGKKGLLLSVSQFATRFSDTDSILLIHGDVFSGPGFFFSGHNDPRSLSTFFESLKRNSRETWTQLKGQCSCLWISQGKIELFRSPFSPHLLFFNKDTVSDQLRILSSPNPKFSELYLKQFVLDYPSLQFSSSLTPLDNVYRVPPASIVTLTPGSDPLTEFLPTEPFMLHEGPAALEDVAKQLRDTLKSILDWHLAKKKPVAAELSGGLDSSFVASFLADCTQNPIEAIMYAYRKHPSHLFSEQCARLIAKEKKIALGVFDSTDVKPADLDEAGPYQNEPVDFFWQGRLFGSLCRDFIKPGSLLFTGFGCDQLLMRNNQILQIVSHKKGIRSAIPLLRDLAKSQNRPALNFFFQLLLSRLPKKTLVSLLDRTRRLKLNPFKVDELVPEVLRTERVSWFLENGRPLTSLSLLETLTEGESLEERFFEPGLPHSNLNYLVAPQYVIQPYLESRGVEYVHPFCDARMIEFVFQKVPFKLIHDFAAPYKNLLREAMRGITPEEVRNRKRDEFSFDGYFFSVLKSNEAFIRQLLLEASQDFSGWIDPTELQKSVESLFFGIFSNSEVKLSRLISYLIWKRTFTEFVQKGEGSDR